LKPSAFGENSLQIEGDGTVASVGPGVQFQIVEGGILGIEADYDRLSNGQFTFGKAPSFWLAREILTPGSGKSTPVRIAELVGEGCAEIVAACHSRPLLPFDVEAGDSTVGGRPAQRGTIDPKTTCDHSDNY